MRILLITQEPPFSPERISTGNALRTLQLKQSLEAAGHSTRQVWLDTAQRAGGDTFDSADSLHSLLASHAPEVLLVSYWELLSLLPYTPQQPVVLDFVAPRPLEILFEKPTELSASLRRMHLNLARADLLLVGSREQEKLLQLWLLEAGFDLRKASPVRVVPLAAEPVAEPSSDPAQDGWTVVGGGVSWPWRDASAYYPALRQFEQQHAGQFRFVSFGGNYQLNAEEATSQDADPGTWDLAGYGDYSAFLTGSAHIGLELSEENVERRFSQSFRSLDFLRHGLPLICNDWLEMAREIEHWQAGWTVSGPGDLPALLEQITADPLEWRRRSRNAHHMVAEVYAPATAARPLLEWLEAPHRASRLAGHDLPAPPPVLGKPPLGERLARQWRLARRIALNRWCARDAATPPGSAIVMVSRGDLFPADHGAAVKIIETARGLSRNGMDVHLVTDQRHHWYRFRDGHMDTLALPWWLRLLSRPLAWVKLAHYTLDIPESNAFLYLPMSDPSFFWRVLYVASHTGARMLHAEFPAYARPCIQVAEVLQASVVLVEHNVEYARLSDQVPSLSKAQYERFRAIEIDLCNRCSAVACVSDNDRRRLAEDGVHSGLLHTVPHGIDLAAFETANAADARERFGIPAGTPILVYHGTFAYPPNRDALQQFADGILPGLEARGIKAHLLAVGHSPPARDLHPRIHYTGSVEHVAPWLKAADLAVVPLRDGGGTRMKIIDYFAAGIAVVSTAKGIEGIPVVQGRHAVITHDEVALTDAVAELLNQPETRAAMAAQGRQFAAGLDWQEIGRQYLKIYQSVAR